MPPSSLRLCSCCNSPFAVSRRSNRSLERSLPGMIRQTRRDRPSVARACSTMPSEASVARPSPQRVLSIRKASSTSSRPSMVQDSSPQRPRKAPDAFSTVAHSPSSGCRGWPLRNHSSSSRGSSSVRVPSGKYRRTSGSRYSAWSAGRPPGRLGLAIHNAQPQVLLEGVEVTVAV